MDGSKTKRLGRRALLAAGAAGVAAVAAEALSPPSVRAANNDPVNVGWTNSGTATTIVTTAGADGFRGQSDVGDGLVGESSGAAKSGLFARNHHAEGYGAYGINLPSGAVGILGSKGQGVMGRAPNAEGVRGESTNNFGVVGASGAKAKAGVFGYATSADGHGVEGRNTATHTYGFLGGKENGVYGASAVKNEYAVRGEHSDPTGAGVLGANSAGNAAGALGAGSTGVWGMAPHDLDHYGLAVIGRAAFPTRSGVLTIAKNKSSVSATVKPIAAAGPAGASMVLATLQTNRAGIYVQAAVASPATNKITIYLNKKVSAATKVAYFILN